MDKRYRLKETLTNQVGTVEAGTIFNGDVTQLKYSEGVSWQDVFEPLPTEETEIEERLFPFDMECFRTGHEGYLFNADGVSQLNQLVRMTNKLADEVNSLKKQEAL